MALRLTSPLTVFTIVMTLPTFFTIVFPWIFASTAIRSLRRGFNFFPMRMVTIEWCSSPVFVILLCFIDEACSCPLTTCAIIVPLWLRGGDVRAVRGATDTSFGGFFFIYGVYPRFQLRGRVKRSTYVERWRVFYKLWDVFFVCPDLFQSGGGSPVGGGPLSRSLSGSPTCS